MLRPTAALRIDNTAPSTVTPLRQMTGLRAGAASVGRRIVPWLAPSTTFIVVLNIHLNHFYASGGFFADSAWFSHLASHAVPPGMANPAPISGQFFATHISPIFWLYTAVSRTALFPFNDVIRFSLYQAGWMAAMATGLQLGARRLMPRGWAALTALAVTFNGIVVAILAFPHVELAIPAALVLFLGLRATPGVPVAAPWIALALGLLVREDAGLHYFGLFATAMVVCRLAGERDRARALLRPAAICLGYGVAAVAAQKILTAGDDGPNLLRSLYLGEPPYAHLTPDLLRQRLSFLIEAKPFLLAPPLFLTAVLVGLRRWVALAGVLSVVPWSLFMFTAVAPHVGAFETYYSFPILAYRVWPLFAERHHSRLVPMAVVMTAIMSTLLTTLPLALDEKPHPLANAGFAHLGEYGPTTDAIDRLRQDGDRLGDFLADDATATLMTASLDAHEWVYWASLDGIAASPRGATIDAVLYYRGAVQEDQFTSFGAAVGLEHSYRFPGSRVSLLTREPRADLVDAWGLEPS